MIGHIYGMKRPNGGSGEMTLVGGSPFDTGYTSTTIPRRRRRTALGGWIHISEGQLHA